MKTVKLRNSSPISTVVTLKYCDTFFNKLLGLMFSKQLDPEQGLILVEERESRINSSIHMMFMNYDILVLWLDKQLTIVDKVLARKWHLYYAPQKPAQFVIELHPSKFPHYEIGDKLTILSE